MVCGLIIGRIADTFGSYRYVVIMDTLLPVPYKAAIRKIYKHRGKTSQHGKETSYGIC